MEVVPDSRTSTAEQMASKSNFFPAVGIANEQYGKMGPYEVSTDAVLGECGGLGGIVIDILQSINILDNTIQCTNNLPYGNGFPITTSVYYPSNIASIPGKLPVVNFVGGILSNEGNYAQMLKLWASHGFVVVVSSDFINSMPEMHILGAFKASKMNKDTQSPLYGKVDMSKMIIAGHSAGGGASLLTSSIPESAMKLIDPDLKVVGSLPIEPGPAAVSFTVKAPTLILTGRFDIVVMPWYTKLHQSHLINQSPAWAATATTATHFSPTMEISKNEFAGISVAWLKYTGYNDTDAKAYFVGPNYKLKNDSQFLQGIHPYRVVRNQVADNLQ
ncbi:adenylate cyclase [Chryseobacterium angstadtii]|uniref:Adenylate cyclase n=1 Tax=Chryseobacterium angstadtii TaxID=558151 RepID=A0A0J7I7A3_9FLAO|nr:adenylate cyclase [Chryseobacterium angstadtii]